MIAGAMYGLHSQDQSITAYHTVVRDNVANERVVTSILVTFKMQVQEWKDILLRGKNPAKLTSGWAAFEQQERSVHEQTAMLLAKLGDGRSRKLMEQFATAHSIMGAGYRKGLEAFKAAGFDTSVGRSMRAGVLRRTVASRYWRTSLERGASGSGGAQRCPRRRLLSRAGVRWHCQRRRGGGFHLDVLKAASLQRNASGEAPGANAKKQLSLDLNGAG